jgi:uncharacterized membrane protein YukC
MNIFIIIIIIIIIILIFYYYFFRINKEYIFSNINDGCLYKRYGCCDDKLTAKLDQNGTNCRGF